MTRFRLLPFPLSEEPLGTIVEGRSTVFSIAQEPHEAQVDVDQRVLELM
jgi:hypothetical protein